MIRPGILTITVGGTREKVIVLGGLAEMSEKGLTVLADVATSIQDIDRAQFAETIAEMEAIAKKVLPRGTSFRPYLFSAQVIAFPRRL